MPSKRYMTNRVRSGIRRLTPEQRSEVSASKTCHMDEPPCHPEKGLCYVASELLYHALGGKRAGLTPHRLVTKTGDVHWYLVGSRGQIYDPTPDQYDYPLDYSKGKGKGFLTKNLSRRAKKLGRLIGVRTSPRRRNPARAAAGRLADLARRARLDLASTWLREDPMRQRALFSASTIPSYPGPDLTKPPIAAEAFTGGGLYSLGLHVEGVRVIETCELNADAVATLRSNLYPEAKTCDAREFKPPPGLDLLTGGPPCQPWSKGGDQLGPDDPRNFYPKLIEWVRDSKPRVFAFENSDKIAKQAKFQDYFRWWWSEISKVGYEGVVWVLNAADYGTPQARKRAWVVGWPKGAPWGEILREAPPATHGRPGSPAVVNKRLLPWTRAFDRLVSGCCGGYGLFDCEYLNNAFSRCETCFGAMGAYPANYQPATLTDDQEIAEERLPYLAQVRKTDPRPRIFAHPPTPHAAEAWDDLGVKDRRVTGYLSPTLVKNIARGLPYGIIATDETPRATDIDRDDPEQMRAYLSTLKRIAPRSAAKLMDVPNWYQFGHTGNAGDETRETNAAYRQIGNGISVNMGRAVARHVLRALGYPVPLPGSGADEGRTGYWPMDSVDPCARFPGIQGYPGGGYFPGSAPLKSDAEIDRYQRPLDQPEDWYGQEASRGEAEAGWDAWGGEEDEYQHDPTWEPSGPRDYPPGFPDYYYFLGWVQGEDPDLYEHYARMYRAVGSTDF